MQIKTIAIEKALSTLRALGCEYIVRTADLVMHHHGSLELAEPKPVKPDPKRRQLRPRGMLKNYYGPFVENMPVGTAVVVPYGGFDPHALQSALSSHGVVAWGKGNSITHRNGMGVEVLRLG